MSTNIWLTDQDSGVPGYKLATIGRRSDAPSLVRSVTATAAGPSSGIQITRTSGGTALAWITEPLIGVSLTAATWTLKVWAKESSAAANASLRLQVLRWTTLEGSTVLDDNPGTELTTTTADLARTTGAATGTTLSSGDRLVFKLLVDDAGTLVTGHTVTVAYNGEYARLEGDSYLTCPDALVAVGVLPLTTEDRVRAVLVQERQDAEEAPPSVTQTQVRQAFEGALVDYTRHRPRRLVALLSGDGTAYDFVLPRGWVQGLSRLTSVEYPTGEQKPVMLAPEAVTVYETVLGVQPTRVLRFLTTTPASATDNILVAYTGRHVHNDVEDSLPVDDLEPVCWLAASYIADWLSADKADSSDATINADTVNHRDGEQRWGSVARRLRQRYRQHIGLEGPVRPASATVNWNVDAQFGDRLVHPRRWR